MTNTDRKQETFSFEILHFFLNGDVHIEEDEKSHPQHGIEQRRRFDEEQEKKNKNTQNASLMSGSDERVKITGLIFSQQFECKATTKKKKNEKNKQILKDGKQSSQGRE